ncbi:Bacterial SNF2 helicase associated [Sporomusa termitida]|uniref:Bacterial SNF2 helicase associated n=2 Tax=Sporomusa termitida TaxID=2377 RepID=A0A517DS39_9FIRM|nr:Bacterial SNF2 helicase associated [Sporomusa termitida]
MLTEEKIKAEADSHASYIRGCHYHHSNRVKTLNFLPEDSTFAARVAGQHLYSVAVTFSPQQKIKHYACDCPAFYNCDGACKHIIAVLKKIQHAWQQYFSTPGPMTLTRSLREFLDFFQGTGKNILTAKPGKAALTKILPVYHFYLANNKKTSYLEFMIGTDRMYVLKDIPQLLTALHSRQTIVFGKNFALKPDEVVFDEVSAALVSLLTSVYEEEKQRSAWNFHVYSGLHANSALSEPRRFKLLSSSLVRFFEIMQSQPFTAVINDQTIPGVTLQHGRPPVDLAVKAAEGGLRLSMNLAGDVFYGLDADFRYIYHSQTIYHVDALFASYVKRLLNCFNENRKPEMHIPAATVSDFMSGALPALETIATIKVDDSIYAKFHKEQLEKRIYLDRFGSGISARLEFWYGDTMINPFGDTGPGDATLAGKWLLRATAQEKEILNTFQQYGFTWSADRLVLADEASAYTFLYQALPELQSRAEILYAADLHQPKIKPAGKITAGVRLNQSTDMLEFSLQLEDISTQELIDLLAAYRLKKRYHRLPDGSFIPLDVPEFQTAASLITELGLSPADLENQVVELPKYRALYLDSLARESPDFTVERSSAFRHMVQDIREPQDIEYPIPPGIQGKLRDYQKTGFKWLKSLANYGLGGILADDMGLGKTLQVIAFILAEKETAAGPSLVIAPTSLVYNWREEIMKFAPSLQAAVIAGQPAERLEQFKNIDNADIVITSYGLIKRDIDIYQQRTFNYCFLDEAQHIKNPNTLNAKSVKQIKAKNYFALTGTPIENTLTELWSIFDFLMPGYLRTHKAFMSRFEIPIVKDNDQQALQELNRHIKPFIMRRMKKAVLKELPEKIESKMVNEMTAAQARLYAAWLLQAKTEFEAEVSVHGFEQSQIKILSLLTRLRQICCHPSLFIENYQGGSGKLEMVQELIRDATAGGHRVLLFSQFTSMLSLIRQELETMKISYHYLDGATRADMRLNLVRSFNSGEKSVFLISLKAGGTGLNLTGADMVIHYDPWWNPAVEDQATDRAYRIGQKNSVQVYKLITKNTIEEKIYLLQQKKKELIDSLIKPGENFLTKMNETEIRDLFSL